LTEIAEIRRNIVANEKVDRFRFSLSSDNLTRDEFGKWLVREPVGFVSDPAELAAVREMGHPGRFTDLGEAEYHAGKNDPLPVAQGFGVGLRPEVGDGFVTFVSLIQAGYWHDTLN
jgi:hypothetical protein